MKRQEVYDMVRDHLLSQEGKSYVEGVGCRYRSPDGKMCAVGCLISDELYKPEIEGAFVNSLPSTVLLAIGAYDDSDVTFLRRLQHIHDNVEIDRWPEAFYEFAEQNDLRP